MKNTDKIKSSENKIIKRLSLKFIVINSALIVFLIYAFVVLVNQQMQISNKNAELDLIEQNITVQEDKNEELKNVYNVITQLSDNQNIDDYEESLKYIERIAREDYDYANKGERIFVNIAGE